MRGNTGDNRRKAHHVMTRVAVHLARRRLIAGAVRSALRLALSCGAASGVVLALNGASLGQQKMTKQQAEYQDTPKDIRMCGTCSLFEPPKSCKVVEGDVSPSGWCKAYAMVD